jgi:YD repeat-containing protein
VGTNDPDGNRTTVAYDPAGNRRQVIDPKGFPAAYSYDGADRLTRLADPTGW